MQETKTFCLCPFDKTHVIAPEKFKKHLEKCRAPTRKDYVQCQYDPLHWALLGEITHHEKNCRKNKQGNFLKQAPAELSSIHHREEDLSEEDIKQINMGFEGRELFRKNHFTKDLKKAELEEKGSNGLWKQPNFSEWYRKLKGFKNIDPQRRKRSESNILNFQDSF